MKSISLKSLKENLSEFTEQAAKGEIIQVTKYNKPFVCLTAAHVSSSPSLHMGSEVGQFLLLPIGKRITRGHALRVLSEDRDRE